MTPRKAPEPKVRKYKVTMRSLVALSDGATAEATATDYVPEEILDAYVEDARTRWQSVDVDKSKHDPGPAGDTGKTARLNL
jgi:hypothetical protein